MTIGTILFVWWLLTMINLIVFGIWEYWSASRKKQKESTNNSKDKE